MDCLKMIVIHILIWTSSICQGSKIKIVPVHPGSTSTTSTSTTTTEASTLTTITTDTPFIPITGIPLKNRTTSSNEARSVQGLADLTFDSDVQKILASAASQLEGEKAKNTYGKRISTKYENDEEEDGEDEEDYEESPKPYGRRRPYGGYYGEPSAPQSYVTYASPFKSFVKKKGPTKLYYPGYSLNKPYTEHYKFYSPPSRPRKHPPRRYGYYGLPIGGYMRDPWYNGMRRRPPMSPYHRSYERYMDRRHSKEKKFAQWKEQKIGDLLPSEGHISESYHDDKVEDIEPEHEPVHEPEHEPKDEGYQKVLGPPPPEILDKLNKLYKKPCYMPHCNHYKKGFIKFSYKKIVFPKKVKVFALKPKPKQKPIVIYQSSPPMKEYKPVPAPAPVYYSAPVSMDVPYGVGGFEYTPSYPTKVIDSYMPDFVKQPNSMKGSASEPYVPAYIPTDYGSEGDSNGVQYDAPGKGGAYSDSNIIQAVPTSGYDSSSLGKSPSNSAYVKSGYSFTGNSATNYQSPNYQSNNFQPDNYHANNFQVPNYQANNFQASNYQANNFQAPNYNTNNQQSTNYNTNNQQSTNYQVPNYQMNNQQTSNYQVPNFQNYGNNYNKNTAGSNSNYDQRQQGKMYFNPSKGYSGERAQSSSTIHEKIVGQGYVHELAPKPSSVYDSKKEQILKNYYHDEAKYDKGPPKDPYGPTYLPEHDLSESYPYERSDNKIRRKSAATLSKPNTKIIKPKP